MISAALARKFPLQCTALAERQVSLAFFSDLVDDDEKSAMAARVVGLEKPAFAPVPSPKPNLSGKRLRDFVGQQSWFLFQLIDLGNEWLTADPSTWSSHPQHVAMKAVVRAIPGVNDMSERDCRLAEDFKVTIFNMSLKYHVCFNTNPSGNALFTSLGFWTKRPEEEDWDALRYRTNAEEISLDSALFPFS